MHHRISRLLSRFWSLESGPYPLLVLLLATAFVLIPLLSGRLTSPLILDIAFSLILFSGAFSLSSKTSVRSLAVVVASLLPVLRWLGGTFSGKAFVATDLFISVAALAFFVFLIFAGFVVRARAPTHRIAGAVTIYILLGLIWARLYELVELLSPGAFRTVDGEALNLATLTYFSFVTLATTGYGDISPINIVARNLAVLEAISGQLFLVILISRLVAEGLGKSEKDRGPE
jgi:hypothetical protein